MRVSECVIVHEIRQQQPLIREEALTTVYSIFMWRCKRYLCFTHFVNNLCFHFLALLHYVSRAHEIEIRQASIDRLSVVRLWHRLCQVLHGFLSNLGCCFPSAIPLCFEFFGKKMVLRFSFYFIFIFVNMGPYGVKIFKMTLLLQIRAQGFQSFPEFSSQWPSQNHFWDFWNVENWNFNDFFFRFP